MNDLANSFKTGPDEDGRFGDFGGRFVSETLIPFPCGHLSIMKPRAVFSGVFPDGCGLTGAAFIVQHSSAYMEAGRIT